MKSKKAFILAGILALVVLAPVIQSLTGNSNEKSVETIRLQEQIIRASILASGTLTHEQEVRLTAEEIGKVKAIYVEEGDRVKKGDLVLEIDDEEQLAALEQSQAAERMQKIAIERQQLRVENLESQLERKKQLYEKDLLDTDSYENFVNELALARVDLASNRESLIQRQAQAEQARKRVSRTKVYAPLNGVVTSLDIKEGETAITGTTNIAGSSLMTVADPASIQTEVYVDEADVANVAVGQKAEVIAIAYPDNPVKGKVTSVAVSAKQEEGKQGLSFAVKIELTPTDSVVLRPGMSCRAEIFTHSEQKVPAVPIKAILVDEDLTRGQTSYYVFVNRGGEAKKVTVTTGISDDQYQQITEGLEAGDEIITGPNATLRNLRDGADIAVTTSTISAG